MEEKRKTIKVLTNKALAFSIILLLIETSLFPVSLSIGSFRIDLSQNQSSSSLNFDNNITKLMKKGNIPSLSACIIKNDSVVWYGGYGFYNTLTLRKPNDDTIYMVGSISKAVTATALLQLYEKGLFSLDDNVSPYLGFDLKNPNYPDVNITFRMLLAHQSSLAATSLKDFTHLGLAYLTGYPKYPYQALREYLVPGSRLYNPSAWTKNRPGAAFNYSDVGFIVLQYLFEQISGQSFEEYCQKNIFGPLNMSNTSFDFHDFKRTQLAVPCMKILFVHRLPFYNASMVAGVGGLITSVEDLSHFLIAQMNGGVYHGVRILNEATVKLMHTIQYPYGYPKGIDWRYGLGWMFFNQSGIMYQGHMGTTVGFESRMKYRESDKTGAIIFINMNGAKAENVLPLIFNELFSKADKL